MSRHRADALPHVAETRLVAGAATAGAIAVARRALMASFEQLLLWQERASQRRHLSMADAHMLSDVGLSRAEVTREIKKPFWRP